jgi:hypothetical protein
MCSSLLNDRKNLSIVTALEIKRIVIGGVDMNDLAGIQANPNLLR